MIFAYKEAHCLLVGQSGTKNMAERKPITLLSFHYKYFSR